MIEGGNLYFFTHVGRLHTDNLNTLTQLGCQLLAKKFGNNEA